MPIVVSMINWKGGVGKTSLTLHLAAGLATRHKKRILLIDLDAQCNLSFLAVGLTSYVDHAYKNNGATVKNIFDDYFDRAPTKTKDVILEKRVRARAGKIFTQVGIILSHQELTLLDMKLAREKRSGKDHREETKFEIEKLSVIKDIINSVADEYDYVLLDCPPNVNLVPPTRLGPGRSCIQPMSLRSSSVRSKTTMITNRATTRNATKSMRPWAHA